MIMKLQNNFTTIEQGKRLLGLGLPADSADCYISNEKIFVLHNRTYQENFYEDLDLARTHLIDMPHYTPSWSVGRLIEILEITLGTPWSDNEGLGESTLRERVVRDLEYVVKYKEIFKDNRIDFSKLEE